MSSVLFYVCIAFSSLVVIESACRRSTAYQDSYLRPTVVIDAATEWCATQMAAFVDMCRRCCEWLGRQFARFTNLYYLLKELFPYEDICNLCNASWSFICMLACQVAELVCTPVSFVKGYYDYFLGNTTPFVYGVVSTLIVVSVCCSIVTWCFPQLCGSLIAFVSACLRSCYDTIAPAMGALDDIPAPARRYR